MKKQIFIVTRILKLFIKRSQNRILMGKLNGIKYIV